MRECLISCWRMQWKIPKTLRILGGEKRARLCYAFTMKKRLQKTINFIVVTGLTGALFLNAAGQALPVWATTISDIQNQINNTQNQIKDINDRIENLTDEQDLIEEKIDDLNAEIINTMTSIGMKEDEIATKEVELEDKQAEIDATEQEYIAAKARQEKQLADMMVRVRGMYENGNTTYLNMLLTGDGLGGLLNRMDYIERIYKYDRDKLKEYEDTKNQVHDLWDLLELEKAGLEKDKEQLEADREALQNQKASLDTMLAQKKKESANYDAEIKKARQEASVAKRLLQQEQAQLKALQAQQNQSNAANGNYTTTSYTSIIDNATGSDLGKKIAKYACQYIGNPYVLGGTSLTKGADCSGFIYRVYSDFNYKLPRTSYEQRSAGKEVQYADAQPGDLICYDGHVGLYIGGGLIVHASNAKTGIKVSTATYRTILSVRRII